MYHDFFDLREQPFSIAPDPHFLYLTARDREALAHFEYGIQVNGGFVQLTGEVGTGKTLLVRALLEQLPDNVDVALILNPLVTPLEFVAAICDELRITYDPETGSIKQLVDALNRFLLENHANGRRTVLIMDEAQNLSRDVLEQVRLLTNLETTKEKLLQIILVGQQELLEVLSAPDLRQLAQRITARYHLRGLSRSETHAYISHRCGVAGATRPLFTRAAMDQVFRLSQGNPRMINILCDRALLGAYAGNASVVEPGAVRQAAREVGDSIPGRNWLGARRWLPVAAGIGVLAIGAIIGLVIIRSPAGKIPEKASVNEVAEKAPPAQVETVATTGAAAVDAVSTDTKQDKDLGELLLSPDSASDTTTAFTQLFASWGAPGVKLGNETGCDRAAELGLRCVFDSGNWNHLRNYNRPAVIELQDAGGQRHHVLVTALDQTRVTLRFGEQERAFPIVEVDRFWYGKYLLVWRPPVNGVSALKPGEQGPAVLWLRRALAWYAGYPEPSAEQAGAQYFDDRLAAQVRLFQRDHQLTVDGVVGQFTFMELNRYHPQRKPPLLSRSGRQGTA